MDGLLKDHETGGGFVDKFSRRFSKVSEWDADPRLAAAFDRVHDFYAAVQMFEASAASRIEEPLLIGPEQLESSTRLACTELKEVWRRALDRIPSE
jgi:hypothetical protein